MRRLGSALLVLTAMVAPVLALSPPAAAADTTEPRPITVLSYNVRAHTSGENLAPAFRFSQRRDEIVQLINAHNPGIFGLQETSIRREAGRSAQWFIDRFDREYNVYKPRKGAVPKMIFFRQSRFRIAKRPGGSIQAGKFHLPSTEACGQRHRTMTWAVLREKALNRRIFVGNVHFPIGGKCLSSRVRAVALIHRMITYHNPHNYPVILMGDFNNRSPKCIHRNAARQGLPITRLVERSNEAHRHNLNSSVRLDECDQTLHGNWPGARPANSRRIDFILHSRRLESVRQRIDVRRTVERPRGGRTSPSDHYAIVASIRPRR